MIDSSNDSLEEPSTDSSSDKEAHLDKRKRKRRSSVSDLENQRGSASDSDRGSRQSSLYATDDLSTEGSKGGGDDDQNKPKSKYKIHIPKRSDLPCDAFFTQPPERSSSPYRIDAFHWKKPSKPSPAPRSKAVKATPRDPHVNSSPTPLQPTENNAVSRAKASTSADSTEFDDTYDYDHLFDAMVDDIGEDRVAVQHEEIAVEPIIINSQREDLVLMGHQGMKAPLTNLKQTTLFGARARETPSGTQSSRKYNWPLANQEEPPTHHHLNPDALKTWIYPTNLGTIRDYQYSIVAKGLYLNLLVALPTGLGKTFIAATIMLNWFRWTANAQIVFVAPTKPLVSQQVKACFEIAGIPRSATSMLTGSTPPGLRAEEWNTKRVLFMTPQTIINDLKTGICDPKRLVLLVVDEAHRATGNYAYVEVVRFVRRFNASFRVLALTATPGSSIEAVQEVIDGLGISRVEIRTEESIDIRQYVHPRKIETILFDNSEEMTMVMDLFSKALQPVLNVLNGNNAYWSKDPLSLTPYGCNQARQRWMSDVGKSASWAEKGTVQTIFSLLASLSHGSDLLKFHGIGPFYHKVLAWRNEIHAGGKKGGKYANQINESEAFRTMMSRVQIWINTPDFIGHPKLEYLQSIVLNHFLDAGEGRGAADPSGTRIMVFAHYRDSAEEIARILRRNEPMIRPHVFVGQASSKGSEGMDQRKQLDIIQKFKSGIYNTLVATSIGEEGLDIGEVDLIVCYDASASPIRMLQRMGRTGRKRAGNIVVTLMKGKEENNFIKAKDNYEKMQIEIASGARFSFRDEESRRIVPKGLQPIVDKKVIEIPSENSQTDLPEPTMRGRAPKRPPKKFHMPDDVRKGFVKASLIDYSDSEDNSAGHKQRIAKPSKGTNSMPKRAPEITLAPLPDLEEVLLTSDEERAFEKKYLDIRGDEPQVVENPRVDAYPDLQRALRPTEHVTHGSLTDNVVTMLRTMHAVVDDPTPLFEKHLMQEDRNAGTDQSRKRERALKAPLAATPPPGKVDFDTALFEKEPNMGRIDRRCQSEFNGGVPAGSRKDRVSLDEDTSDPSDSSSDELETVQVAPTVKDQSTASKIRESDEELPDFTTLVQDNEIGKKPQTCRRKAVRRIIQDESDE